MIMPANAFLHKNWYCIQFLSPVAVLIGFEQDSYTAMEGHESITLCVNMTTGTSTVLVSLKTLDIGSAQGTYSYYNSTISG